MACHPGPCPPCAVVISLPCHCGHEIKQVRCSSITGVKGYKPPTAAGQSRAELLSCGEVCRKDLGCGMEGHGCTRVCHEGDCGSCEVVREKKCYCGRHTVEERCGDNEGRGERVECVKPSDGGDTQSWVGEWTCKSVCDA